MPDERDHRIYEMATGFALGELDEDELKEFYNLLREPGEQGTLAGRLAWEALGATVDLRSELGNSFQDSLFLRLAEDGGEQAKRFAEKVRGRLGHSRPRLQPIEAPAPTPRRRAWPLVLAVFAALAGAGLAIVTLQHREPPVALVAALVGAPTLDGRSLGAGSGVDRRQLSVPSGAQLTLRWADGSEMTIAGPAGAVAGTQGISLLAGRAWCHSVQGLAIGLPDRPTALPVPAGTSAAFEIRDNRSVIGVTRGRLEEPGLTVASEQVVDLAHPGAVYPWRREDLPRAATAEPGAPHTRWNLSGSLRFRETEAAVVVRLVLEADHAAELALAPGSAALRVDGREVQRLSLGGAPLAERDLTLRGERRTLTVAVGTQKLEIDLPAAVTRLSWDGVGGDLGSARFSTGPEPEPPFAVPAAAP